MLTDLVKTDSSGFIMTFTANKANFFDNIRIVEQINFEVFALVENNGRRLTVYSDPIARSGTRQVTFAFGPALTKIAPNSAIAALAAPEPATWTMMIAGFGLVGAALRRRRRSGDRLPVSAIA